MNGNKLSLSDYSQALFDFFADKCDKEVLREKIVCDLLCCSSSVHIPESLKIADPLYKKAKKHFAEKLGNGTKIAILYSNNRIFAVSENEEKNFHNRFEGEYYDIDTLYDSE